MDWHFILPYTFLTLTFMVAVVLVHKAAYRNGWEDGQEEYSNDSQVGSTEYWLSDSKPLPAIPPSPDYRIVFQKPLAPSERVVTAFEAEELSWYHRMENLIKELSDERSDGSNSSSVELQMPMGPIATESAPTDYAICQS